MSADIASLTSKVRAIEAGDGKRIFTAGDDGKLVATGIDGKPELDRKSVV